MEKRAEEMKRTFTDVYKQNRWLSKNGESISGNGSMLSYTENLRAALPRIFEKYGVVSVLDLPCGDFNWMSHVDLDDIDYIGADVVSEIIELNRERYPSVQFEVLDIAGDDLPGADLIICRDLFVHFSNRDIERSLLNIKGKYKYILTTTFPTMKSNGSIRTGRWHPTNVELTPFNLGEPLELISEQEVGTDRRDGKGHAKMIGLYSLINEGSI